MENKNNTADTQSELILRLFSAFIMVAISLAGTYLGGWFFAALILLVSLLMLWEWYSLTDCQRLSLSYVIQLGSLVLATYFAAEKLFLTAFLVLMLSTLTVLLMANLKAVKGSAPIWTAMGSLYAGLPCIAMIWFRHDFAAGFIAVFYLFALSWSNDSAAFFGGRTIGGAKLAPRVSPNKTWAGFISGLLASILVGLAFAHFYDKIDPVRIAALSLMLGIAVQVGDLAESALKRYFGLKDSSALIPGHGGILDRVDGLVFAVCLAAIYALFIDSANPGAALLFGNSMASVSGQAATASLGLG